MNAKNITYALAAALVLAAGIFLRVCSTSAFDRLPVEKGKLVPALSFRMGKDETIYANYLGALHLFGVRYYGPLVRAYKSNQEEDPSGKTVEVTVHPLRMTYLLLSLAWLETFHSGTLTALHAISSIAAVLHLLVAGIFAWRLGGKYASLGVLALMAFAPLQICLAQRALVDGFYGFEATLCFWLLWENLRAPNNWWWLAAYAASLVALVMTKEYSAFVVLAFCILMAANHWLKFGAVTLKLLVATVIGPALGVLVLMYFAGGFTGFFDFYILFLKKSHGLDYAIKMQDGPWTRYLLDFLIVSPAILLLAVGRIFQLERDNRPDLFCALFLIASYVPMACVTYGMSLRFAAYWDFPLCWLAWSLLRALSERLFTNRKTVALAVAVVLVCGIEMRDYRRIFVEFDDGKHQIYDPVTENLLQADKILK
ncbi:MAG TPA: hypothetical protein VG733_04225 [Chthoniobacteraceae bacterium]|nr:hypothetical protein [Chthoniobacteraceae bacterium]